jgi:hypothetical protein
MNKNKLRTLLRELTEEKAPAAQIDLWPAIQSRVQQNQLFHARGLTMKTSSHSPRWQVKPAYILTLVILIGAGFLMFPQGRALAQAVMHFFYRGESNLMPGSTLTPVKWVEQTPGVAAATFTPPPPQATPTGLAFEADCGSPSAPHCSIEDLRQRAAFPVYALPRLPDGLHFDGATGGPDQIMLVYSAPGQTGSLVIWEKPFTDTSSQLAGEVGADAVIQSVQVGAVTAEYVKGSYDGSSNPPVWNSNAEVQELTWVDQGLLFNLYMLGTQPRLGRDDLAALAATLIDGPVTVSGAPAAEPATPTEAPFDMHTLYPLTLAEAETKAEFTLQAPARLPETLSFMGAKYDETTKVVNLFYVYHNPTYPETTDGLLVNEQRAPEGADCDLCGFILGNGKQADDYPIGKLISTEAKVETVQLGAVTGQYVEGIGWTSKSDSGGWQWDATPYVKKLRFRTKGLAIELAAYTFELTKAELLTIAESLR